MIKVHSTVCNGIEYTRNYVNLLGFTSHKSNLSHNASNTENHQTQRFDDIKAN